MSKNSRAPALPSLLLGLEDALQATRVEVDEDKVGVDGLVAAILLFERLCDRGVRSPVGDNRAKKKTMERKNKTRRSI